MRVLVVYNQPRSASADVAASVAEVLGADTEVVREDEHRERFGALGALRNVVDLLRRPPRARSDRARHYDVIVIAVAGWEASTSPGIRGALRRAAFASGGAAFVYVGRAVRAARVLRRMQNAIGRPPVAVLTLNRNELKSDASMRKTLGFADEVRAVAERIVDRRRSREATAPPS